MCTLGHSCHQRGFSLIELIVFIVIVSVSIAGVLIAINSTARSSAEPLVMKQALAIAEALLEEVELMPFTFCDPDDAQVSSAKSATIGAAGCATTVENVAGPEAGETRYSTTTPFDNVNDYNGFNTATNASPGIRQIDNTVITALSAYSASVAVTPLVFNGIPATDALLISVTVTGPANVSVKIDGIRTRYAPNL